MSMRTRLIGLAAAGTLAACGAACVVPQAASALKLRSSLSISGVEGSSSVEACTGGPCAAGNQLVFLSSSGHAVTFTAAQTNMNEPLRVVATDTLWCESQAGNIATYTFAHNTAYGTTTLTFQPDLTCPPGQFFVGSEQSAEAQAANGMTTPYAELKWN
jgi:hypothetical protein